MLKIRISLSGSVADHFNESDIGMPVTAFAGYDRTGLVGGEFLGGLTPVGLSFWQNVKNSRQKL